MSSIYNGCCVKPPKIALKIVLHAYTLNRISRNLAPLFLLVNLQPAKYQKHRIKISTSKSKMYYVMLGDVIPLLADNAFIARVA